MKKIIITVLILGLFLTGCQEKASGTLDTTQLVLTESELESVPLVYEAPSLEEGLDALPFNVNLPENLPFDAMPLKLMSIEDFKHDGKELRVDFMSVSKKAEDKITLTISVHNFKVEYAEPAGDDVKLANGMIGSYIGNSLTFEKDGIYYAISYNNETISDEEHQKQMIDLANQML